MKNNNNRKQTRDARISAYIQAVRQMARSDFAVELPVSSSEAPDEIASLGIALQELAISMDTRQREERQLETLISDLNAGMLLDDVLEKIYLCFQTIIPFNRIGFSVIEPDGKHVQAYWGRSEATEIQIAKGYRAPLEGSSLKEILETGQPRVLNNLEEYLAAHPDSQSTRMIVSEGVRSSLTCPLIANHVPVGFIFFSSFAPDTYRNVHVELFQRIAGRLSIILEKSRLVSELTERKAVAEAQNEELRRVSELKNTFLGIAAHDLRGPMSTIRLAIDLIRQTTIQLADPQQEEFLATYVQIIQRQADHMLTMLNDLLDITQIESGKLTLNFLPVDLREFLSLVVRQHNQLAAPKGSQVLLDEVPKGHVRADPLRLQQVLDNLITNAVKYSPPGSTVCVRADRADQAWKVSVRDEGPGITMEDRKRLFQDFARLSARPTGGEKSVGLGLAITRRVVEEHHGKIDVDSIPGKGATFWFTIPDDTLTNKP